MGSLGTIIFLVILVGGWIIKAASKANEDKDKGAKTKGASKMDYDELAARRRAELQAQAQQRRAGQTPAQTQAGAKDPSSMTMAERIEMARQRSAQKQGKPTVDRQAQALRQAQQDALRQRQEQQAQQQAQQKRQQQAQRQRQQKQQQSQRQPQSLKQQRAQQAHAQAQQKPKRSLSSIKQRELAKHRESHERVHKTQARDSAVRRQEARTAPGRRKSSATRLDFSRLNRKSLRQAIIMKEVLDKPIALRESQI